jgi:hypothetical protein
MAYRIQIYVDEVTYGGDDIGDDFRFEFLVDGNPSSLTVFGKRRDEDGRAAKLAIKLKAVMVPAPRGP